MVELIMYTCVLPSLFVGRGAVPHARHARLGHVPARHRQHVRQAEKGER